MPNLNIIITSAAELDMQSIFDYIAQDNQVKANEMLDLFENKFEVIAAFPKSGSSKFSYIKRDVRICIVAKHYQIVYSVHNESLVIHRVLTGYQNICTKI